jgi:NADH dehydrogenase
VAQSLPRHYEVMVFDGEEHFEFAPNLHELISGLKRPGDLRLSRKELLHRRRQSFHHDWVTAIDADGHRITTASGAQLGYDLLVVALGGTHQTHGIPGVLENCRFLRSVDECTRLTQALRQRLGHRRPCSVVIVGGGLEGVEVLGEILRLYREHPGLQLHLLESQGRLLGDAPSAIHRTLEAHCAKQGVQVHLGTTVTRVEPDGVVCEDEHLPSDLTIWTAGMAPPPFLFEAGLAEGPGEWAAVRPTLQSELLADVFVIGDAAGLPQRPAKQAYHALAMGSHLADNLERYVAGRPLQAFEPPQRPVVVTFGDLDTFMIFEGFAVAGRSLAPLKEAVYHLVMTQLFPPSQPKPLAQLFQRTVHSVHQTALPSWRALRSLPDVHVLTSGPQPPPT